jgi:hypothetical protein
MGVGRMMLLDLEDGVQEGLEVGEAVGLIPSDVNECVCSSDFSHRAVVLVFLVAHRDDQNSKVQTQVRWRKVKIDVDGCCDDNRRIGIYRLYCIDIGRIL